MKESPILFSTPMVQAIVNDLKLKTRRTRLLEDLVIDLDSGYVYFKKHSIQLDIHNWQENIIKYCPYGEVGDLMWVRETFGEDDDMGFFYKANYDQSDIDYLKGNWKPSIHMPKAAARIWLEVVSVRVERLRDISEDDAKAEGVEKSSTNHEFYRNYVSEGWELPTATQSFFSLWHSINGIESWKANPWVWVIEFKKIDKK